MSKRGPESYMKRQKELKRKQKAMEKMARRQGKKMQQAADAERLAAGGDVPMDGLGQQELQDQGLPTAPEAESSPDSSDKSGAGD